MVENEKAAAIIERTDNVSDWKVKEAYDNYDDDGIDDNDFVNFEKSRKSIRKRKKNIEIRSIKFKTR